MKRQLLFLLMVFLTPLVTYADYKYELIEDTPTGIIHLKREAADIYLNARQIVSVKVERGELDWRVIIYTARITQFKFQGVLETKNVRYNLHFKNRGAADEAAKRSSM